MAATQYTLLARAWGNTRDSVGVEFVSGVAPSSDLRAYVLRAVGDGMAPRLKGGEWIIVEPGTKSEPGDDVAVRTIGGDVSVRQFVGRIGDTVILGDINDRSKRICRHLGEFEAIHYVAAMLPARAFEARIAG